MKARHGRGSANDGPVPATDVPVPTTDVPVPTTDVPVHTTEVPLPTTEVPLPARHPYLAEIEAERVGWYELVDLVRGLTRRERLTPGYYRHPDWSAREVVGHVGTWLAEAQIQLERIGAGTYEGHDVDVDVLNATFLEAMRDQPWEVAWVQANAGRTMMLQAWYSLREPSDEAAWWIRKAAADHYAEHLDRLRDWVTELLARRTPTSPSRS